jgi:hypothetical protein
VHGSNVGPLFDCRAYRTVSVRKEATFSAVEFRGREGAHTGHSEDNGLRGGAARASRPGAGVPGVGACAGGGFEASGADRGQDLKHLASEQVVRSIRGTRGGHELLSHPFRDPGVTGGRGDRQVGVPDGLRWGSTVLPPHGALPGGVADRRSGARGWRSRVWRGW